MKSTTTFDDIAISDSSAIIKWTCPHGVVYEWKHMLKQDSQDQSRIETLTNRATRDIARGCKCQGSA